MHRHRNPLEVKYTLVWSQATHVTITPPASVGGLHAPTNCTLLSLTQLLSLARQKPPCSVSCRRNDTTRWVPYLSCIWFRFQTGGGSWPWVSYRRSDGTRRRGGRCHVLSTFFFQPAMQCRTEPCASCDTAMEYHM